jgi:hypothetical protein
VQADFTFVTDEDEDHLARCSDSFS